MEIIDSFRERLPIRSLKYEKAGKSYCLNRILDLGGLGRIVAEIDDDMSLDPDWIDAVLASCDRRPDVDVFGGHVYVVWPPGPVPVWATRCCSEVIGWAFSAHGKERTVPRLDRPIRRDRWPCGNHFWVRSRLLTPASRFADLWETAPGLIFDFVEKGAKAVVCTEIVAGHRVHAKLLDESFILARAEMIGWTFANIFLRPHRPSFKMSGALSRHPVAMRVYFSAMLVWFRGLCLLTSIASSKGMWFERKLHATQRVALYREMLRIAALDEPYRIARRKSPRPGAVAD